MIVPIHSVSTSHVNPAHTIRHSVVLGSVEVPRLYRRRDSGQKKSEGLNFTGLPFAVGRVGGSGQEMEPLRREPGLRAPYG